MSKLTDSLRTVGVFNSWEFYGKGHVYISRQATFARNPIPSAWKVVRPGYKTDPDDWHYQYCKAFSYVGRDGANDALEKAKAWASERYGITEWARDPFGTYGDAEFVKARTAELKARVAEASVA